MAVDLFDVGDLPGWLSGADAELARRAASGWLQDATGLTEWPDPVPDRLWAWAIELAAIALRNPDGATSEQVDDYRYATDRSRRTEILTAARTAYNTTSSGPQYAFPAPDWHWQTVPCPPQIRS